METPINADLLAAAQANTAPVAGDTNVVLLAKAVALLATIAGGSGGGRSVTLDFTRPADTTAYAANDVVGATGAAGGVLTFTSMGASAGAKLLLTGALLVIDRASVPSGMAGYRLHLFKAAPADVADNAAFPLSASGDKAAYIGYIDFPLPVLMGGVLVSQPPAVSLPLAPLTGTTLYAELVTLGAHTPASGTAHKIILNASAA